MPTINSPEAVEAAMDYAHEYPITRAQWAILEPEASSCPDTSCIRILAAEVERLRAELAKLADPVAVHINMLRGTIATPSRELMEHVWGGGQPATPQPLDRPDKPGWWWYLSYEGESEEFWHRIPIAESDLSDYAGGKWLPATAPTKPWTSGNK